MNLLNSRIRKGITFIEVALVLGVVAVIFIGLAQLIAQNAGASRARIAAQKLEQIAIASSAYLTARSTAIESAFAGNPAATLTIPVGRQTPVGGYPVGTPGLPSLQEAGFLPPGFVDRNGAGQSHVLLVRRLATGRFDAIVTAFGGDPISDIDLSTLVASVGAAGGAVFDNATPTPDTHIVGAFGGWSYSVGVWTGTLDGASVGPRTGRPAVSLSMQNAATQLAASSGPVGTFLSRVETANPSDTTMSADLNMGGKSITGVEGVSANGIMAGQRYVWSKEGLYTEGNVWSRNGVSTEGSVSSKGGLFTEGGVSSTGGLSTEGSIWSRGSSRTEGSLHVEDRAYVNNWLHSEGGIGTHGPIWAPRNNVYARAFCDENGANCFAPSAFRNPEWCRMESTTTSTCSSDGRNPAPPACPSGYWDNGVSNTGSGCSSNRTTYVRSCYRMRCGAPPP